MAKTPNRTAAKPSPAASAPAPTPPATQSSAVDALLGSDAFAATIDLGEGRAASLGDVVRQAHSATGLSAADWNALEQPWRDAAITTVIEQLKGDGPQVPAPAQAPDQTEALQAAEVTVIMLTGLSGPAYSRKPGDEHPCPPDEAERLIAAGYARAKDA